MSIRKTGTGDTPEDTMIDAGNQGGETGRAPRKGDAVSFGRNECVIEVAGLSDEETGVAGVHAIIDQYGGTHFVEDLEPSRPEPAWEIVLPGQLAQYAA